MEMAAEIGKVFFGCEGEVVRLEGVLATATERGEGWRRCMRLHVMADFATFIAHNVITALASHVAFDAIAKAVTG